MVAAAFLLCAGCASQSAPTLQAVNDPKPEPAASARLGYTLTDKERALDCKVIRGRMKIALLKLQTDKKLPESTSLSRNMQSTTASIFGGTKYGTDPAAAREKETARLHAFNKHLKSQNCRTFDLQKELAAPASG